MEKMDLNLSSGRHPSVNSQLEILCELSLPLHRRSGGHQIIRFAPSPLCVTLYILPLPLYRIFLLPFSQVTGKFHKGDSYILLSTRTSATSAALNWDIHFWLGSESSQDEIGICAYKTVELDEVRQRGSRRSEGRLERSDSTCIIPPSYITNSPSHARFARALPLLACSPSAVALSSTARSRAESPLNS